MNSCNKFRQTNFSGPHRVERNGVERDGVHTGLHDEFISFFIIFIHNYPIHHISLNLIG